MASFTLTSKSTGGWTTTGDTWSGSPTFLITVNDSFAISSANAIGTLAHNTNGVPADFGVAVSIDYEIDYQIFPLNGDTETLWVQLFKADGTTALTDEMQVVVRTTATSGNVNATGSFTGVVTSATVDEWDTCRWRLRTLHQSDMGKDGSQWHIDRIRFPNFVYNSIPTIVPNTADAHDFGADDTPTLEFTGSDTEGDDLEYQFQIDTFPFNHVLELSYLASGPFISPVASGKIGMSFRSDGTTINSVDFHLRSDGSLTGDIVAEIFAHSGTFGVDGVGTGSVLATSNAVDGSTIATNDTNPTTFTFGTPYTPTKGVEYVVVLYRASGAGNYQMRYNDRGYAGNNVTWNGTWNYNVTNDIAFTLNTDTFVAVLDKLSVTPDLEFLNTVTGGDTHPFNEGEKISYTVQAGDALADGTYYWRARCTDPSGSNLWSSWTTARSFDIGSSSTVLVVQESSHSHAADNVALTQKNTLAMQESSHSHAADNVALTQKNTLVVAECSHAHTADNVTLDAVKFNLTVQETVHSHTPETPNLLQAHTLAINDSTHGHTVDNVSLTQKNTLVVSETLHSHAADNVDLVLTQTLVVQESSHGHTADNVALTQKNTLTISESTHGHTVDSPTLTQKNTLTVAESSHSHVADNVVLTQKFTLVVAETVHSHTVDNTDLTQKSTLTVSESTHGHTVDNVALTQKNTLVVAETIHNHLADNVTLSIALTLTVQDSNHGHTVDNVALTQKSTLTVSETIHNHTVDNVALTQKNTLTVSESTHSHTVDNTVLVQDWLLTPSDSTHGHTTDAITLTQKNTLVVAETLHGHLADNVVLELPNQLVVQDSTHGHTAENVDLSQGYTLGVQETTHGHIADSTNLSQGYVLVVQDSLHSHSAEIIILVEKSTLVVSESLHNHLVDSVLLDVQGDYKLYLGTTVIDKVYLGNTQIDKIYLGETQI
jgi:hypothetical protein